MSNPGIKTREIIIPKKHSSNNKSLSFGKNWITQSTGLIINSGTCPNTNITSNTTEIADRITANM